MKLSNDRIMSAKSYSSLMERAKQEKAAEDERRRALKKIQEVRRGRLQEIRALKLPAEQAVLFALRHVGAIRNIGDDMDLLNEDDSAVTRTVRILRNQGFNIEMNPVDRANHDHPSWMVVEEYRLILED